jgi:predicted metal-dependent HD superfamily phosphohydrolase
MNNQFLSFLKSIDPFFLFIIGVINVLYLLLAKVDIFKKVLVIPDLKILLYLHHFQSCLLVNVRVQYMWVHSQILMQGRLKYLLHGQLLDHLRKLYHIYPVHLAHCNCQFLHNLVQHGCFEAVQRHTEIAVAIDKVHDLLRV